MTSPAAIAWQAWSEERNPTEPVLPWELEAAYPPGWSEVGRDSPETMPPDVAAWTLRLARDRPMEGGLLTTAWVPDWMMMRDALARDPLVLRFAGEGHYRFVEGAHYRWWIVGVQEIADFAEHIRFFSTWQEVRRALHDAERSGRWDADN